MNPLTNIRNITKLNERELSLGIDAKNSWHNMYRESAWVFIGGLNFDMSEGDIITVFSQYGEVVNINLIRDQKTGKSKGYCFLCYEDQRSTVLAVDNFNGIKLLNRTIRCDHVSNYRMPKEHEDTDLITKKLYEEGCAPQDILPLNSKQEDKKQVLQININIKSEKKKKRKRKRDSSDSSRSSSDSRSKKSKNKSKKRKSSKLSSIKNNSSHKRHDYKSYDREKSEYSRNYDKEKRSN